MKTCFFRCIFIILFLLLSACMYEDKIYGWDYEIDYDWLEGQEEWGVLYPFWEDGLWGYKDADNNIVIEPQFSWASDFSEGLAFVLGSSGNEHLTGYIDATGKLIISLPNAFLGSEFIEGFAFISERRWDRTIGEPPVQTGLYGPFIFINRQGINIFNQEFIHVRSFNEGFAGVLLFDGRNVFINRRGEIAFDMEFMNTQDFINGYARVTLMYSDIMYGENIRVHIDRNGNIIDMGDWIINRDLP